ncbi:hypothetical protein PRIPAC_86459 [Pristionchus pacificus]|nr:hypothetical protein PRIPAC_86459 [Pristionchus pacificus]|eukprot:PDM66763.1 hypothetical protein PRIPAC_48180 [Pristionchus pacificus]
MYHNVVNVVVFDSFVIIILGVADDVIVVEGGDIDGVTMVVGRTGVIPNRWGELLNFLIPPLPPLPPPLGVPPPPPNTTDGVFRRDSIDHFPIHLPTVLPLPPSVIPGEVLPDALLPGGEGDREERMESGEAARRPLNLNDKRNTIEIIIHTNNSCSAWGDTLSRELAPPPPNIETEGDEFL